MNRFGRWRIRQLKQLNIVEIESRYDDKALLKLMSSQNQSPDNPILHLVNLNWLTRSEALAMVFIAWATENQNLRSLLLVELTQRYADRKISCSDNERWMILRFLQDCVKRRLPFYQNRRADFFFHIPLREILGVLNDPRIRQSISKRLRPRLWHPPKPVRAERIRGYRDHGTARPSHKWLPKDLLTDRQRWKEHELREFNLLLDSYALTLPWKEVFYTKAAHRRD
jgi:hypothetical protein